MRHFYRASSLVAATLLSVTALSVTAHAQQATGVITGHYVGDLRGNPEARLIESSTNTVVQTMPVVNQLRTTLPEKEARFTFHDVPYGRYRIEIWRERTLVAYEYTSVSSAVPVTVELPQRDPDHGVILVEAERGTVDPEKTGSSKLFTAETIRDLPAVSNERRIEAVLLNTPGVVPDEDGRLHVRGEDAAIQYVIDGIPITANMTRVYSTLFNANLIKTVSVQTGGLDAEYGVATAGVLAITTKSGFDHPFFANAAAGYGSFNTKELSAELGGNVGGQVAGFLGVATSESDRYLDPISGFDPINDHGRSRHIFGKVDAMLGEMVDLDLIGSYNGTIYSVPNAKERVPAQDQKQDMTDYMVGVHMDAYLSQTATLSALAYHRKATGKLTSGGLTRISSSADSLQAVTENERFFVGADRSNEANGGQLELSLRGDWLDMAHEVKAGVGGEIYPLHEFFTFAVVNPALSDSNVSGGDARYVPYDLTRGGHPFLVDAAKTGHRYSAFLQDRIRSGHWTVSAGLRYDLYSLLADESAVSPRLSAAYEVSPDLVLRAGYSRIFMQAPIENILVSSSSQARLLAAGEQASTPNLVTSEKSHSFELGAAYRLNEYLSFDLVGYGKLIDDFIVKVELGNSGIIFPVNLKQGLVAGGELRAELRNLSNFSASLSIGGGAAIGMKPEDGTSPIAAGLILGEEGRNYSHPWGGEDIFPTEHNQMITAAMTVNYHEEHGLFATLGGRFDSGLPFDLTDRNGNGLTAEQSRQELINRGYSEDVIDMLELESEEPGSPDKSVAPHVVLDAALGLDFEPLTSFRGRLTLGVQNILDTPYLYKFESSFSSTHYGIPRSFLARLEIGL